MLGPCRVPNPEKLRVPAPERRDLPVADLLLDPENPRLPEDLQGADQPELLRYLNDETVLEEIIRSLNDNGFFEHEPLIAYEDDELEGYVVLEGNRRLAALKVLLGAPEARDQGLEPLLDTRQPLLLDGEPGLNRGEPPDEAAKLDEQRGDQRERNAPVDRPMQLRQIAGLFRERHVSASFRTAR